MTRSYKKRQPLLKNSKTKPSTLIKVFDSPKDDRKVFFFYKTGKRFSVSLLETLKKKQGQQGVTADFAASFTPMEFASKLR